MQVSDFFSKFDYLDLPIHGVRLPVFVVEDSYKQQLGIKGEIDNYDFLRRLCQDGFKELKLDKASADYQKYVDRVKYELDIIKELGFVD